MIHLGAVERHIFGHSDARLCDSKPASECDVSSEHWMEPRGTRCRNAVERARCRRRTCTSCRCWRKSMRAAPARIADGHGATVYDFTGGLVTYFAPGAPESAEAGELKGDELAAARLILDARGLLGVRAA